MKHARKAKSAAKSFRINRARMKKTLAEEVHGDEDVRWSMLVARAFSDAAGFFCVRKKLGHDGSCTVSLRMYV